MQSSLRAATAAAATIGVLAATPVALAGTPADSTQLRQAVTTAGIMEHQQALQGIATANGGTRASGTPGYDASLAYVKSRLEATGFYDVTVQEFLFNAFRELAPAQVARISPDPRVYDTAGDDAEAVTMDYSGSGDVTGRLVATNDIVQQRLRGVRLRARVRDRAADRARPARHLRLHGQGGERAGGGL